MLLTGHTGFKGGWLSLWLSELGAEVTGFSLPDAQIHSPNERLVADYVPLGIATARELFRELAAI